MPFYEYQCSACGQQHEELQKINARPLRKCPACGRATLRRLVSAPVFRLKGGGWYETDFKADKEGQRNIAGDKEPASTDGPAVADHPATADHPPAEKPKEEKAEAKPAETKATTEAPAKPAAEGKKSKPAAAKPASTPARRRRRTARR
jgi:putative FmdB family regulatory protein